MIDGGVVRMIDGPDPEVSSGTQPANRPSDS